MNFFAHRTVAERYAQFRPYFHPVVIEQVRSFLHLANPVERSLDVGCGTGQSTLALKELSNTVIGVDVSSEMLEHARQAPGIEYIKASGEDLSFLKGNSFDLITCSMAYHWFDPDRFLKEVHRLLRDNGWLIIYNNGFTAQMKDNEAFKAWCGQRYGGRYPTPPRNNTPLDSHVARSYGFSFHAEEYENDVQFTPEKLASYLTTQSNVIAAVEQGKETIADVHDWLVTEMTPYFPSETGTFVFKGFIWYLQKQAA